MRTTNRASAVVVLAAMALTPVGASATCNSCGPCCISGWMEHCADVTITDPISGVTSCTGCTLYGLYCATGGGGSGDPGPRPPKDIDSVTPAIGTDDMVARTLVFGISPQTESMLFVGGRDSRTEMLTSQTAGVNEIVATLSRISAASASDFRLAATVLQRSWAPC